MKLLHEIYRQRVEFLRRGTTAPNLLLVPLDKKYELLGECVEGFAIAGAKDIHIHGMKVMYVDPQQHSTITAALGADALK